ncbi:uncharacterized protein BO80DRAFT_94322 [Aspergillus ibericus CBS 121593]|uniref:Secreted protein n=1 Tax=Aspergillus ibericus CBS 121593 TaxID=1448316 RepID=A0A395GYJ7_9EURO|nr:hypothetical protein BO80DRAFT_94322 [Aspergillus ibericus CBS 121593]RAL00647.1 hypothetical protein BO80DRAFT_94322 [Aspergillus ibericus CBS 121593]
MYMTLSLFCMSFRLRRCFPFLLAFMSSLGPSGTTSSPSCFTASVGLFLDQLPSGTRLWGPFFHFSFFIFFLFSSLHLTPTERDPKWKTSKGKGKPEQ